MFCSKCGQRIADDSRFCKFCGAPQDSQPETASSSEVRSERVQRPKDNSGKIIAAVIGVILLLIIAAGLGKPSSSNPGSDANTSDIAATASNTGDASAAAGSEAGNNWSYWTDTDKVRGGTIYYASTTSTNSVHQGFPYSSATTMDLVLRQSKASGSDVMLKISSGQMMCPSYEGCSGTVRFDSGPAQNIRFVGTSDNDSEVVFVEGAKAFIAKLRKAKRVVIEKTLYQAGAPQFEFNLEGLKWEH